MSNYEYVCPNLSHPPHLHPNIMHYIDQLFGAKHLRAHLANLAGSECRLPNNGRGNLVAPVAGNNTHYMVNVRSGDKDTRRFTYTQTKVPLRDIHILPPKYSSSEEEDTVFAPGCTVTFLDGRPGGKVVSRRHGWYRVKVPGNKDLLRVRAHDLHKQRSSQSRIALGIDAKLKVCTQSYDNDFSTMQATSITCRSPVAAGCIRIEVLEDANYRS